MVNKLALVLLLCVGCAAEGAGLGLSADGGAGGSAGPVSLPLRGAGGLLGTGGNQYQSMGSGGQTYAPADGTGGAAQTGTGGAVGAGGQTLTGQSGASGGQDAGPAAPRDGAAVASDNRVTVDAGDASTELPKCIVATTPACATRADCPRGNDCLWLGGVGPDGARQNLCQCFDPVVYYSTPGLCPGQPSRRPCASITPCDFGEYCSAATATCQCLGVFP